MLIDITALFYAGYGAILTPAFGIASAYGDDQVQYNNALGLFVISMPRNIQLWRSIADILAVWTVFVLAFLVASLPTNIVYILIFTFVFLAFLFIGASYFAVADGNAVASVGLKKAGGAFSFLAGLTGWYVFLMASVLSLLVYL